MGCGDEKLSKSLTQTFTAHCNAMICQQVTLSGDAEWPKVADAVIEAFLGMAIFTQKNIAHQALSRLIDDQGFPWQGATLHLSQGFEAPLTRFNTVAINNFHPIPWQPGGACTVKLLNERP